MEYVAGQTLDRRIGPKGMKIDECLQYGIQIADALAAAHAAGIVHRDLKPGNILVTDSGKVKVLDFGLATVTQRKADSNPRAATTAPTTEDGRVMGTAAYMSPEQAEGKSVDARSDIFSFGSVLCEMITGSRPFHGDSSMSTMAAILTKNPAPMNGAIPSGLQQIVQRCLGKDPARRAQSIGDISDRGLHFVDFSARQPDGSVPLKTYDPRTRKVSQLALLDRKTQIGGTGFTVSRDGLWIAWKQTDRNESNLMLIEDFR